MPSTHSSGRYHVDALRTAAQRSRRVMGYIWSHPANRDARIRAVVRAVAFQGRSRLRLGPVRARVGDHLVLEVPLHAAGASKAVYANPPDWGEMQSWRRLLRPGDLFVDVGSNAGLYAVWAADCGATPIAVEPDPVNARRTRRNLQINDLPIEVHECALGAESGRMDFTVGGDTVNHLVPGESRERVRSVDVRTLDDVLRGRRVRGVKIDVEGAERLVLDGASATLREQRADVLQLEWNSLSVQLLGESRDPVRLALQSYGYVLCEPNPARDFALMRVEPGSARVSDVFAVSPPAAAEMRLGE